MVATYGEDIPPATVMVSFGKPIITDALVPPLLMGPMECYWSQNVGYSLNDRDVRSIFYDAKNVRTADFDALASTQFEKLDEQEMGVIGLGQRLGPFWYPASGMR